MCNIHSPFGSVLVFTNPLEKLYNESIKAFWQKPQPAVSGNWIDKSSVHWPANQSSEMKMWLNALQSLRETACGNYL